MVRVPICGRKLVDDLVRVGWNLLSQNVSLNTKTPRNPCGLQGVEKNGKYELVGGGHRVDTRDGLKPVNRQVRPRFVFTSVKVTDVPESSKVASTPR